MKVLCIGAHPDDIELGLGGLISQNKNKHRFYHISFASCKEVYGQAIIESEELDAMTKLGIQHFLHYTDLPVRKLSNMGEHIRNILWDALDKVKPDLVFTHNPNDLHSDHAEVGKQTIFMCRNINVWCYEIMRSNVFDLVNNIFYPLTQESLDVKVEALMCYKSQSSRDWYRKDMFIDWAKMRGIQCGSLFAEAFWSPKLVVKCL